MNKFYFVGYLGKQVEEQHLLDLKKEKNVLLISENVDRTKFRFAFQERQFSNAHKWERIKDKDPIGIGMWNKYYSLYNLPYEENDTHYIIFWDSAISVLYSEQFFRELKNKHKNIRLVFYVYDQMNRWYSKRIERMLKYADLVLCTIPEDCKKYGFEYFPLVYSKYNIDSLHSRKKTDIYFLGNNSDRVNKLHKIYEYLKEKNVMCDLDIVGVTKEEMLYEGEITYNVNRTMNEHLEHVLATNCILEIMHDGMNAVTARYPEILQFNKKLITNNKAIVNEKYYNPKYIKIYEKVEDIDVEWVKERIDVDYGYEGDFSPLRLIDKVLKILG